MLHESLYHLKPTIMCHCFAWRVFVLIILRFSFYVTSFRPKNNLILIYPTTKYYVKWMKLTKTTLLELTNVYYPNKIWSSMNCHEQILLWIYCPPFVCFPKMQPCSFKRMKIIYILFIIDASHINWSFAFKLPKEIFMTSFIQKQIKIRWFMNVKSIMG